MKWLVVAGVAVLALATLVRHGWPALGVLAFALLPLAFLLLKSRSADTEE